MSKEEGDSPTTPTSKHLPKLPKLKPPEFEPLSINAFHSADDDEENENNDALDVQLDEDFEEEGRDPDSEEESKSFQLGLKCIYLPIHSQIDTERRLSSCSDLVGKLLRGYGFKRGKNSLFDRYWSDFEDDCFPSLRNTYNEPVANRARDITLDTLRQRKYTIENDGDQFYNKSSFNSEKEYLIWKKEALSMNEFAYQSAVQAHQKKFECNILVNVEELSLSQDNKALFGIASSMDILYKIRKGNNENDPYLLESKVVTGNIDRKGNEALNVSFEEKPFLMHVEPSNIISIKFFYRYLKKTNRFGFIELKISDLLAKVEPPKSSWGSKSITETYDLLSTENNSKIGTADVTVDIQFQKFPSVAVETNPVNRDNTSYQEMFNILVDRLIKSRSASSSDESALDFDQSWIIQEFSTIYNISEVTKRLAIVSALNDRPDLMCTFSDYFRQSFDFLHNNNSMKFVHTTKNETKRFHNLVSKLTETCEKILLDFKKYTRNKKNKSLKEILDVYQLLMCKYGDEIDEEEFISHVKDCIEKNIHNQYKRLRNIGVNDDDDEGGGTMGPKQMISLCVRLIPVIGEIKKFSDALPKYVNYEKQSITIMYNSFASDFEEIESSFSGKEMLQFCDKLKELNEVVKASFKESEREDVNLLDFGKLMDGAPRKYLQEIKASQKQAVKTAVIGDEWAPTSESEPYSSSLIEMFNAAASDLTFLNKLHHIERDSMIPKFAETVVGTVAGYIDTLRQLCIKDVPIVDQEPSAEATLRTIPEQFIVRLNDIYAARMHVMHWINNLDETADTLVIPSQEDLDCDFYHDINKYNEVQMHKRDKTMALKIETEDDDNKITPSQQLLIDMTNTVDDLLDHVTENYAPFIKATMVNIITNMKKEIGKKKNQSMPKEDFISAFGQKIENAFVASIIDGYLQPLITDFGRISYGDILSDLTRSIFDMVVQQMTNLIITEDDEPFKPLKPYQVTMLEIMYRVLVYYMDVKKTGGIKPKDMDKRSRLLRLLFKIYDLPTPEVINLYVQFTKYPSLNRASRVKDRHIIALLNTRKKDGHAKKFVAEHWKKNEEQRVVSAFGLKFPETELDILLYSAKCKDKNMSQFVAHLTKVAVCVESKRSMFNGRRQIGITKADLRSTKSVVTASCSRIFLTDITAVRQASSIVLGKGLKVYFKEGVVRMYFKSTKHRDAFQNALVQQGKKLGNKKVENEDKDLDRQEKVNNRKTRAFSALKEK